MLNYPTDIINFCANLGIHNPKFFDKCNDLKNLLIEENKKYNLTRIVNDIDFWNKHIADSLSVLIYFNEFFKKGISIADVGCGAGFPSLVLALALPESKITAIDSIGKKTSFVKLASEQLGLKNLSVITGRARELKYMKEYNIVTARAVGEPLKIFKETSTWLSKTGKLIIYRSVTETETELKSLQTQFKHDYFQWQKTEDFTLPNGSMRTFLYCTKR